MCADEADNNPKSMCVSIDAASGWGHCFRCNRVFILEEKHSEWKKSMDMKYGKHAYRSPTADYLSDNFGARTVGYLKHRCISSDTAHRLGLKTRVMERRDGTSEEWVAFPFYDGERIVDVQYKLADTKEKRFFFEKDCEKIPYNINSAVCAQRILITEGMMDVAACVECGYEAAVSLPNGTNSNLHCFDRFMSYFGNADIVYAGDTDAAGMKARTAVAEYFGESRVKFVEWCFVQQGDDGTEQRHYAKDANQMLMQWGKDGVRQCVENARRMKVRGLVALDDVESQLDEIYRNGLPRARPLKVAKLDNVFKIEDGLIYLGFAAPGSGKSTMLNFIMMSMVHLYATHVVVYSPEKYPMARHYSEMINIMTGKPFGKDDLPETAYRRAKECCRSYIHEIDANVQTDMDGILHVAQQEYYNGECDMLVIDPFNWIQMPGQAGITDTMKYSMMLMKVVQFAHEYSVPVIMMHHPRKYDPKEKLTLNDIYGSSDFGNKSDYVFWIDRHKDDDPNREVTLWNCIKSRWGEIGHVGAVSLKYSQATMRYAGCCRNIDGTYSPICEDTGDWTKNDGVAQQLNFQEDDDCPF